MQNHLESICFIFPFFNTRMHLGEKNMLLNVFKKSSNKNKTKMQKKCVATKL